MNHKAVVGFLWNGLAKGRGWGSRSSKLNKPSFQIQGRVEYKWRYALQHDPVVPHLPSCICKSVQKWQKHRIPLTENGTSSHSQNFPGRISNTIPHHGRAWKEGTPQEPRTGSLLSEMIHRCFRTEGSQLR